MTLSPRTPLSLKRALPSTARAVCRCYSSSEGPHINDSKKPLVVSRKIPDSIQTHERWTLISPTYTSEELHSVKVVHRENKEAKDYIASALVTSARFVFDLATRYKQYTPKPEEKGMSLEELRRKKLVMTEKDWLARALFLESIAGVPGSAASVLRHLKSLRTLKRDGGLIHTLLAGQPALFPNKAAALTTMNRGGERTKASHELYEAQTTWMVPSIYGLSQPRDFLQRFLFHVFAIAEELSSLCRQAGRRSCTYLHPNDQRN